MEREINHFSDFGWGSRTKTNKCRGQISAVNLWLVN